MKIFIQVQPDTGHSPRLSMQLGEATGGDEERCALKGSLGSSARTTAPVTRALTKAPEEVLARARGNLQRLRTQHPDRGMTARWLGQWQEVLDAGVDAVADVLTSQGLAALELRQNSPFAGVISEEVRSRVLASFVRHWRRDHGQPSKVTTGSDRRADRVRVSG